MREKKECQICGGQYAVLGNTFAKDRVTHHGYRKENGFYYKIGNGCFGAGEQSYDRSCDACLKLKNICEKQLNESISVLKDIDKCKELYEKQCISKRSDLDGRVYYYRTQACSVDEFISPEDKDKFYQEQEATLANYDAKDVESAYEHKRRLDDKRCFSSREIELRRTIESLRRTIVNMNRRINQWIENHKPAHLSPLENSNETKTETKD